MSQKVQVATKVYQGIPQKKSDERRILGFSGEPSTPNQWIYVHSVLSVEEIENIPKEYLKLAARSRRITLNENKKNQRRIFAENYVPVDMGHYAFFQCGWWLSNSRSNVAGELGREPSEIEFVRYIQNNPRVSESWKAFYCLAYPDKIRGRINPNPLCESKGLFDYITHRRLDHMKWTLEIATMKALGAGVNPLSKGIYQQLKRVRREYYQRNIS